jgi:hypothetical protein
MTEITESTNTYLEYAILLFNGNYGYANASQSRVIHTLPVVFEIDF